MAATPLDSPVTSTGTLLSVLVPLPSSPPPPDPQHFTPRFAVRPHVWNTPADSGTVFGATSAHVSFGSHWPGGMGWRLKSGCSVAGLGLAGWDSVPGTSKA